MAPSNSQLKGKPPAHSRDKRSRSRNSTPVSVVVETSVPSYLQTHIGQLVAPPDSVLDSILDQNPASNAIPTATVLSSMLESVKQQLLGVAKGREEGSHKLMRELAQKRKERVDNSHRERERAEKEAIEERKKQKKIKKEERPLAVGAHGIARQDGVDVHKNTSSTLSSPLTQSPTSPAAPPDKADSPGSQSDDTSPHQPAPAPKIQHFEVFGPDPVEFFDPTVYHIRDVPPDIDDNLRKEILSVADYPHDDLHDLTPGTPPDKDFSNAKPASQVTAQAFANYVEPYIRPLTEEDIAFLRERGNRETPFVMPPRGARGYKELWTEEDGQMHMDLDISMPPNEARGSVEQLNDDAAETDEVSSGPVVSRLLSMMLPSNRETTDTNGDTIMTNGDAEANGDTANAENSATHMPESKDPAWKTTNPHKLDPAIADERILRELISLGFISADQVPQYDNSEDDEVAARLRLLQESLREQILVNGARKARILELAEDRMAQQEYSSIAEDLDTQLNQAYAKRNRNIGKGKKNVKRPGGAGGGSHFINGTPGLGVAAPKQGLGETIKGLMDRRGKWNEWIGPVVENGQANIPRESIFEKDRMDALMKREQDNWNEGEDA
ncbi:hypothetical protein K402DRAFT_391844 [Aulographum hederae CBS 113979]|uniref:Transcriptional regulator Ngg1 n=1 Tax=Aulographum hederae CBS 113979 TaxID=1176131 RepID=A0A6G1H642_9PEZI|nr:hypothetical protein K402DRAFT_391844 [Aulographum hederae CBS 113979]